MRSLPERIRSTIWGVFSQILSNARLYSLYLYTEAGDVLHSDAICVAEICLQGIFFSIRYV